MEPWNHRTMEPWNHRTMEPWNHKTMEPWNRGTVEPWNRVTIGKLHSSVPFSAVLGFAKTTAFGRLDTA